MMIISAQCVPKALRLQVVLLKNIKKNVSDLRVKLRTCILSDLFNCLLSRQRLSIDAIFRHRIVRIRHSKDT